MEKVYLSRAMCDAIHEARSEKHITSYELADAVGRNPSWMSRVENFKVKYISREDAEALSKELGIVFDSNGDIERLTAQVHELSKENKMLKKLLAEKWSKE